MKLIDTHTHINLRAFKDDAPETIQRALDTGVALVNVGTQIDTSRQAVELLKDFSQDVYATVGLHPTHASLYKYEDADELETKTVEKSFDYEMYKALARNERVVGIGECGLDYYRLPEGRDHEEIKKLQHIALDAQIKLAIELDKALCIHCRPSEGTNDAYEDLLAILTPLCHSREGGNPDGSPGSASGSPEDDIGNLRFEVHCFTGDLETAQKFIALGGFIGFNGIITFDKSGRSETVVKSMPLEAIILETDAPYLAPAPFRGKRNEPAYVMEVAKKIAEWKNIDIEEVARFTTANAKKLFNLPS